MRAGEPVEDKGEGRGGGGRNLKTAILGKPTLHCMLPSLQDTEILRLPRPAAKLSSSSTR